MNEQIKAIKDNARLYVNYIKIEHGIDLHNLPENAPLFMRLLAQSTLCVKGLDVDYCVNLMPLVALAATEHNGDAFKAVAQSLKCDKDDWGYLDELGGRVFIRTSTVNYVLKEGHWGFTVVFPKETKWYLLPKEVESLLNEYREYLDTLE